MKSTKLTKKKLTGLKSNFEPDKKQTTLEEAFQTGKLLAEAKVKKRQALLDLEEIEVSYVLLYK